MDAGILHDDNKEWREAFRSHFANAIDARNERLISCASIMLNQIVKHCQ
jgi:hypothetical protein